MADTSQPARIKVPLPSGGFLPAVREVFGREILQGKRATLECGVPHVIHGVDPADNTGGMQGPKYLPQYYAVMNMWEIGNYAALCTDIVAESRYRPT